MALLVRDPDASRAQLVPLPPGGGSVRDWLCIRCRAQGIPEDSFYVKCNGRLVNTEDLLQDGVVYSLEPRLCGGKGGFGSMLRALGAQIEKTTNREACRDLSGRRLRDVNHEKAMAEWVKQQAEREAEKEQRRLERLQRKLAEPKHFFTNPDYQQQCHEMAERLEDSVLKGMQASSSKMVSPETSDCRKRPNESEKSGAKFGKRQCFWMGVEGLADPESSGDGDSDSEDDSPSMAEGSWQSTVGHVEKTELASEWPSSSEDSIGCSSASNATEKSQEQPEDLGKGLPEEVPAGGQTETPAADEKNEAAKTLKDGEQETVSATQKETNQLQSTEPTRIDLLAFNSAAEMEELGLEKLKFELMALGLKCGGTLQERAARLFSVRGLSKDQIDPALFAKPSKGKKK
ncbi:replication stress response regulator SDE2 [Trachemys scripta elegans]|uniref:replication stress response regulator SDE2 n=1 Tax=Trachemys scripta elegans TaxID=31138 RepID=UPI001554C7E6|nr:replication stress response regulator SDE2 [Trachemys scripta elegans]